MSNSSPHHQKRRKNSLWGRFRQNRRRRQHWGEASLFTFIFITGLVFTCLHFCVWVLPQLTLFQEFIPAECLVLDTKIIEQPHNNTNGNTNSNIGNTARRYQPLVLIQLINQDRISSNGEDIRTWAFDYHYLFSDTGVFSDYESAKAALDSFRKAQLTAAQVKCFCRPDNPEKAVIYRDYSVWGWLFFVLFIVLTVLGVIGFLQSFRIMPVSEERFIAEQTAKLSASKTDLATLPDFRIINESSGTQLAFRLPLANQSVFPLIGITVFCIAWNLIACGILFYSFMYRNEDFSGLIMGTVMRSLFFAVGIALLVWVSHQILVGFGIAPTILEISDHPIEPGRRYRVHIQQNGILRFRHLMVEVICEEIARFRQGTETITNRKIVFRQPLYERSDFETTADSPFKDDFFLCLPLGAMHSFRQENNEIVWKISVFAQISGWHNLRRECPIVVRPSMWTGQDSN
ncbi:hypothetical protein FACS1894214_4250 [Planctomycetales bacterium]|nr:hypothetical protein FACS1894214_4250 [Planctomycetales bacterium]